MRTRLTICVIPPTILETVRVNSGSESDQPRTRSQWTRFSTVEQEKGTQRGCVRSAVVKVEFVFFASIGFILKWQMKGVSAWDALRGMSKDAATDNRQVTRW
jgi:hypothetical protein